MASLWNKDSPKFCTVGIKLEDAEAAGLGVVGNATSTTGKILTTDTDEMVKAMASVWEGVFSEKPVDCEEVKILLDDYQAHARWDWSRARPPNINILAGLRKHTKTTRPGPDGIPYAAWRRLGPLAASVLYEAARELSQEQGLESMLAAFPADEQGNTPFNEAVAVFIPKKLYPIHHRRARRPTLRHTRSSPLL